MAFSFINMIDTPPATANSGSASAGCVQHAESALRSTAGHPGNAEEDLPEQERPSGDLKQEAQHQDHGAPLQEQQDIYREQPVKHQDQKAPEREEVAAQQTKPLSQQAERHKIIPHFHFSPNRGSLHERRRSRSLSPRKMLKQSLTEKDPAMPTNVTRPLVTTTGRVIGYPTPPGSSSNSRPVVPIPLRVNHRGRTRPTVVKPPFNIFQELLKHQDLTLSFICLLPIDDFIGLYAISKDLHTMVNRNATTFMKHYARVNAPGCSQIFQFRFYGKLCMKDPTPRPNDDRPSEIRSVPTFRWLRMIVFRHNIVRDMILTMAADGMRMPEQTHLAIKKCWFLLDLPYNNNRVAIIHNTTFWTDQDLYRATLWFVKIDMLFGDPITGTGNEVDLRKLLFAQRSLTVLWRALRRELLQTELDIMQLYAEAWYAPPQFSDADGASLMGIPAHLVGRMNHEGWGKGPNRLLRPDELVLRESLRRDLRLDTAVVDMMSYGFVDEQSWNFLPFPGYHRVQEVQQQQQEKKVDEETQRKITAMRLERGSGKGKKAETVAGPSRVREEGKDANKRRQTTVSDADVGLKTSKSLNSGYYSGMPTATIPPPSARTGNAAPSPFNVHRW